MRVNFSVILSVGFILITFTSCVESWCMTSKQCPDCQARTYRRMLYGSSDCSSYYYCVNGEIWRNMRCDGGNVYSQRAQRCVHPDDTANDCPYRNQIYPEWSKPQYPWWSSRLPSTRPPSTRPPPTRAPPTRAPPRPRPPIRPIPTRPPPTYRPQQVYDNCGIKSSPNIIGGGEATNGEWPWQVSLQYKNGFGGTLYHTCGAVLIDSRWVLTAAHCVIRRYAGLMRVVIGAHNLMKPNYFQLKLGVQSIHMHKGYQDSGSYPNDIALLKLADPVDLSSGVYRTLCLPKAFEAVQDESSYSPETGCWITGWGGTSYSRTSDTLQELKVDLVENSYCARLWRGYVSKSQVCVGMGNKGACKGDSGGPLACSKNGRFYLAGLSSWGEDTCREYGYPNIYTKVSNHVNWIKDTMRANRF